jgi:hypothetical protein
MYALTSQIQVANRLFALGVVVKNSVPAYATQFILIYFPPTATILAIYYQWKLL